VTGAQVAATEAGIAVPVDLGADREPVIAVRRPARADQAVLKSKCQAFGLHHLCTAAIPQQDGSVERKEPGHGSRREHPSVRLLILRMS